jgi:hypothetical protein
VALLEQIVWLPPVLAMAARWIVTTTWAVTGSQGASWPVVLSVSVTVPAVISAADGLYVAFSVVAFGAKLPVPEDDQVPPVAPSPTVPPRAAVALPEQIVWLPPVLAVAAKRMVTVTCAVATAQAATWPVEVSVSVTVPAAISAADGLYVAPSVVAFGANAPVPEDVQRPPVAPPPTVPPKPAVALLEQIVWLPPALAVATRPIVMVMESLTAPQGPSGLLDVKVTVALPAAISAAVG